jgi:colanic acid biosynthesis glycosyl transferase WcaI
MRILIHGLNFAPELVGCGKTTGEMAEWLAARGHEVRVVTAPPFNPEWRVAPGFSPWRYSREDYVRQSQPRKAIRELVATGSRSGLRRSSEARGQLAEPPDSTGETTTSETTTGETTTGRLTVLRCPVWVPRQPSAVKRILHLVSFALASFPVMLRQIRWRPEVVLVMEPTLFCVPAALLTGRFCGAKSWLHVLDFEADAGFELGLLKSAALKRAVGWAEKKSMSSFDRVSTISEKMLARLVQKGVAPSACLFFPNWVDTDAIFPLEKPSAFRAELGISPNDTVALYAGTMARKQGLEVLAEAACQLGGRARLRFVFCGDGPGKSMLATLTSHLPYVQWIPLQPFARLNDLLNLADIHLLPQKADAADLVMPSKLTGMLASGRPVVAASPPGTQLAQAVEGRGLVVAPGNARAFAQAIEQLAEDSGLREKLGRNARQYALSVLEKESVLSRLDRELLFFAAAG